MPFLMSQFTGQQEAQADLALKQQQLQANAFRLQQAQKAEQQQEDYFSTLQASLKEQPTPTQGSITPEGQVTSPTISILEKAVRASKNVDQYNSAIKALDSARKTEADVQLKNLQIKKDKDEHIVAAAMHGLSTGDIAGAIAMYAQYDPKEALQAYSMLSKATPEQQKTILQRLIAEHSTGKEIAGIQKKHVDEKLAQDKFEFSKKVETAKVAQGWAKVAQGRERLDIQKAEENRKLSKDARREKRIGKLSDPKEVERTADSIKEDHPKLDMATRNKAAEDVRTRQKELMRSDEDMSAQEAYDQAYDEISSKIKDDKGYLFGFGAKSTYGKESKPVTTLPSGWTVKEK